MHKSTMTFGLLPMCPMQYNKMLQSRGAAAYLPTKTDAQQVHTCWQHQLVHHDPGGAHCNLRCDCCSCCI